VTVNISHKNDKPNWRSNPRELFRASYPALFAELETTTDRERRKEIKGQLKRLAKRAGVMLGREFSK
jgi:hypothetical protein